MKIGKPRRERVIVSILFVFIALVFTGAFFVPPIPQDPAYHQFSDQREVLRIPNFWNVITNFPFFVVGVWCLVEMKRITLPADFSRYRLHFIVFFAGVLLVSWGSAYYHLDPSNRTLVWDRLPMTVAFMAFCCAVVGERMSRVWGVRLLWPLIVVGVLSVAYWHVTESQGVGDLRPYGLVQFLPMLLIPLLLVTRPARILSNGLVWLVLAAYALAKVAEHYDADIFSALGFISGHSIKHLLAALGAYCLLLALKTTAIRASKNERRQISRAAESSQALPTKSRSTPV